MLRHMCADNRAYGQFNRQTKQLPHDRIGATRKICLPCQRGIMGLLEIFLIALGLAMDACAASICKGLTMGADSSAKRWCEGLFLAALFGAFQALMPLAGYLLGNSFAAYVAPVDHWIAFILLGIIGGKMLVDALRSSNAGEDGLSQTASMSLTEALGLAIATSIDAFVVGCSFAFVDVNVAQAVTIIGLVAFLLSLLGFLLGKRLGTRYNKIATIVGGVVLILIGAKILLEHLGVL